MAASGKGIPLAQEYMVATACIFQPVATLDELTCCLRHRAQFTQKDSDMTPAAPGQLDDYAADLKTYAAVTEA